MKEKLKKLISDKYIFKIMCIFIILQPIFDLLSFLYIRNYINIGISTIAKPLIVFVIGCVLLLKHRKYMLKYMIIYGLYALLMVVHSIMLKNLEVELSVILHEIRFMINILYMLIILMDINILYKETVDKDVFVNVLKKVIIITFAIYIAMYFLAIITGTSALTYEYSDALKQGFKGWLDSGQIFGHALCILLPIILHILLNNKIKNQFINTAVKVSIALPIGVLLLIGTKVTYFIAVLVLLSHSIINFIYSIKEKNKTHFLNSIICLMFLIVSIWGYQYSPVKTNIDINNQVLSDVPSEEKIDNIVKERQDNIVKERQDNIEENNNEIVATEQINQTNTYNAELEKYNNWDDIAFKKLEEKYRIGELHPSDLRNRQLVYNVEKYKLADIKYKIFGLGYLNQNDALSIERDFFALLFNFGVLGFCLVLIYPIKIWMKSTTKMLKNLKKVDLETLYLYEGVSMFFFISIFAGYTFIYTNFSIFLVILLILLKHNVNKLGEKKLDKYFKKIFKGSKVEFNKIIKNNLENDVKTFIVTANPETIMTAEKNEELKKALLDENTIIIPDGIGLVKGANMLGYNVEETIPGVELCTKLFEYCNAYNKSIFLLGAKKEVIEKLVEVIKEKYPNANICGYEDGYIEDKQEIFEKMAELKPDVVLVALGIPNQELLIYDNIDKFNKGIFVGVGGSFDVLSGSKKRAPKIFRKLKLEWLYRITTEPKRLSRFFYSNIKYIAVIIK